MNTETVFPKFFADFPDSSQVEINCDKIVIQLDELRKITITPLKSNNDEIFIGFHCYDKQDNILLDQFPSLFVQFRCSNHVQLKNKVFDNTGEEVILAISNPEQHLLQVYPFLKKDKQVLLQLKKLIIQFDNERYLSLEMTDGNEIKMVSFVPEAQSKNKFAMLHLKPGACNVVIVSAYLHNQTSCSL